MQIEALCVAGVTVQDIFWGFTESGCARNKRAPRNLWRRDLPQQLAARSRGEGGSARLHLLLAALHCASPIPLPVLVEGILSLCLLCGVEKEEEEKKEMCVYVGG